MPSRSQPGAEGPSGSQRKVHSSSAGGAASSHTVPQRSRMVSSSRSDFSTALVAGAGSQVNSASCALGLGSVASLSVHHTTGAVLPRMAGPALAPLAGSMRSSAISSMT